MRLAWILVALTCLAGCKSIAGWWNEPVSEPTTGAIELPGGGTYTPPADTPPGTTLELPGGGTVVYQPQPVGPVVTKGDAARQGATGAGYALFGPFIGSALAAVLGVADQALKKKVAVA